MAACGVEGDHADAFLGLLDLLERLANGGRDPGPHRSRGVGDDGVFRFHCSGRAK